jgi:dienelactone hydrolase
MHIDVRLLERSAVRLAILILLVGCTRLGSLGDGYGHALTADGYAGLVGPHPVEAWGVKAAGMAAVIYAPADVHVPAPAVIFLPGRVAPEWQYESYGRALASHGIVVATRGWYSPFKTDPELASDAIRLADWLVAHELADPHRLGVAGHSMGGKAAIMAALRDPRFSAVVGLEPDDNGRHSVVRGPIAKLQASLLIIGAEVDWKGWRVCSTRANNYEHFFAAAPPGTMMLTLLRADHVQVMDSPDELGMGICRRGTADSHAVRTLARLALVGFFANRLAGEPEMSLPLGDAATLVTKDVTPSSRPAPAAAP